MPTIRPETEADFARVFEVQAAAFEQRNEAEVVDALRRAKLPCVSLVAEEAGRIVGHIFFSPVEIEGARGEPPLGGLAPVGVEPECQGQGIGGALVRAGLEACKPLGWRAVFLVGAPAYYSRFGFVAAAPLGFTYGNPHFDAALQVIELEAGALEGHRGRVVFHSAFAENGTG
jgi:putative acetyltransferase